MVVSAVAEDGLPAVAANAVLTIGSDGWTLGCTLDLGPSGCFSVPLRPPAGWRISRFHGDADLRLDGSAPGDDLPVTAGEVVLSARDGFLRPRRVVLDLVPGAGTTATVAPVAVPGARRTRSTLDIHADSSIATTIATPAGWRLRTRTDPAASDPTLRTAVDTDGDPEPVTVAASPQRPACTVEAVVCVLPGRDRSWCRLDLRLEVTTGRLDGLDLTLPFAATPALTAVPGDGSWSIIAQAGGWRLHSERPWSGERLLRLEGALAPAATGQLPQPTAMLADGTVLPVRLTVTLLAAADGDVTVERGTGWHDADADTLPSWSAPIPGEPLLAVLRRLPGSATGGTWRVVPRDLAALPTAFIDRLELLGRVGRDGCRVLARCRLAAPGLQALPLGLPAEARLLEATIDGVATAPRTTASGLVLPLPGRTLVQLALLYDLPAPGPQARLVPPAFGGLPVTATTWTVGADAHLRARLAEAGIADNHHDRWRRPWFGSWSAEVMAPLPIPYAPDTAPIPDDPRALVPRLAATPPVGEPQLLCPQPQITATRLGGGAPLVLALDDGDQLRWADRLGQGSAVALAGILVWLGATRRALALGGAGLALAGACHAWQVAAGPWMALGEWLAPALVVLAVAARLGRRLFGGSAAILLLAGLAAASASETMPVLMGYDHLDDHGRPVDVRVAVPRERFTALWAAVHPRPATTPALADLATGLPIYRGTLADRRLDAVIHLPWAVPGDRWRSLSLPLPPGTVTACSARETTVQPAWQAAADGLHIDLPPRSQGTLCITLALDLRAQDGGWRGDLPLIGLGGTLELSPAETGGSERWRVLVAGRPGDAGAWNLPTGGATVPLALDRVTAAAATAARAIDLDQRLQVRLVDGGLRWHGELDLGNLGGSTLDLTLPTGLVLTAVEGPEVADWHQERITASVRWRTAATRRTLALDGCLVRAATTAALAVRVAQAGHHHGRLDLGHGAGARFLVPGGAGLLRADPQGDLNLAVRWEDDPGTLVVAWAPTTVELRAQPEAALLLGAERAVLAIRLRLQGRGVAESLRWSLPEPWLVDQPQAVVVGTGNDRRVVLRSPRGGWTAGSEVLLVCSASRRALGARVGLPDALPQAPGLTVDRPLWLVGGADDGRVRIAAGLEPRDRAPVIAALPPVFTLAPGEAWLVAGVSATPPAITEETVPPRAEVRARHYAVLAQDRLRWWVRLDYVVRSGALGDLRCTLPPGTRLMAVRTRDLGSWQVGGTDGRELAVRLSVPTSGVQTLELDLEQPLGDGAAVLTAPATPWPSSGSVVALVDEDGSGLIHLDPQGLEPCPLRPGDLPPGVEAAAVPHHWQAERTAWRLALRREAVGEAGGADGVVTLVEGLTALAPGGACRSRATWHLLNRTRTRLELAVPPGVTLWDVRVDGRPLTPRAGGAGTLVLPVAPMRPGAAATRIEMVWQTVPGTGRQHLEPPRLTGVNVVQAVWRCAVPAGWHMERLGGGLDVVPALEAERVRAERVLDDVARLKRLAGLNDAGLRRQAEHLALLDQELGDRLTVLEQLGAATVAGDSGYSFISTAKAGKGEVQQAQALNRATAGQRALRRQQLQIGNAALTWASAQTPAAIPTGLSLGPGEAQPGWRGDERGGLLGIELLPPLDGPVLDLRGQGSDLSLDVALTRDPGPQRPWWWLGAGALWAAAVAVAGIWAMRHRQTGMGRD